MSAAITWESNLLFRKDLLLNCLQEMGQKEAQIEKQAGK